jgi:hypothetical protein
MSSVTGDANPQAAEARLAQLADALADAIEAAIPGWVEVCVRRHRPHAIQADIDAAAAAAVADGMPRLRALLHADVDEQRTNPLAILRSLVRHPTEVLRAAGVQPVARDDFAVRAFPDDVYDLVPASFADVDPSLREPGLLWGAAKAHIVLRRRPSD